jgi:hypothetical protein
MSLLPVIEKPQGAVNGVNRTFFTSGAYVPGSVQVFKNGLMGEKSLVDGWTELGSKKIRLLEAPKDGDVIQVYYLRP